MFFTSGRHTEAAPVERERERDPYIRCCGETMVGNGQGCQGSWIYSGVIIKPVGR